MPSKLMFPDWLGKIVDEIEERGREELTKESSQYTWMDEESSGIVAMWKH